MLYRPHLFTPIDSESSVNSLLATVAKFSFSKRTEIFFGFVVGDVSNVKDVQVVVGEELESKIGPVHAKGALFVCSMMMTMVMWLR